MSAMLLIDALEEGRGAMLHFRMLLHRAHAAVYSAAVR